MKDNSYDIPAYKFAILKLQNEKIDYTDSNQTEKAIKYIGKKNSLIPFECIDGLTINEIKELTGISSNNFIFFCYNCCNPEYPGSFPERTITTINVISRFVFSNCNGEDRIDTIIENRIIKIYNSLDEKSKKAFNCFLERYQDKDVSNILKKKI